MAKYMGQTMSIPTSTTAPTEAPIISGHPNFLELCMQWMELLERAKLICPQIFDVSVAVLFSHRELRCELFHRI